MPTDPVVVSRAASMASLPVCFTRSITSAPASPISDCTVSTPSRTLLATASARLVKSSLTVSLSSPAHSFSISDVWNAPATVAPIARPIAPTTSGCRSRMSDSDERAHSRVCRSGRGLSHSSSLDIAEPFVSSCRGHCGLSCRSFLFVSILAADGFRPVGAGVTAARTSGIADSSGDMGHRGAKVGMLLGTRSERANLAAIHRGHKPLPTCCCTRRHNRPHPKLVRRELQ